MRYQRSAGPACAWIEVWRPTVFKIQPDKESDATYWRFTSGCSKTEFSDVSLAVKCIC